ncbi:SUZ domain-containing protein 1-like isoform X1 [Siniperca chuatsi]|uniref:SUZ domain-containing protein 1-like isoform X1 n=1 Tax=Siniperca chuatsi TaxID=119488 RepID=UPI001CE1E860|nr:SUZ domain-containing protein 1-like isoform X1 [Siniperca chuatsi]
MSKAADSRELFSEEAQDSQLHSVSEQNETWMRRSSKVGRKLLIVGESSNNSPRSPLKTTMVIQDDSLPAVPPPPIRILKRPASNGSLGSPLNQNRPTPQVKSLAQREAEYAEARKRILGSACPEETAQDKPNTDRPGRNNSTLPSEDTRSNNHTVGQPSSPNSTQGFRQHR